MADNYSYDPNILADVLDEAAEHKQRLLGAESDNERLAVIEKVIAYSTLMGHVASWMTVKVRGAKVEARPTVIHRAS